MSSLWAKAASTESGRRGSVRGFVLLRPDSDLAAAAAAAAARRRRGIVLRRLDSVLAAFAAAAPPPLRRRWPAARRRRGFAARGAAPAPGSLRARSHPPPQSPHWGRADRRGLTRRYLYGDLANLDAGV
jgi:hypothetical protein